MKRIPSNFYLRIIITNNLAPLLYLFREEKKMKDLGYFVLGITVGLGLGTAAGYILSKKKAERQIDEEIEAYAEYAEAKIEHMKSLIEAGSIEEPERVDEEVQKNEGVKKYHHQEEGISSLSERKPFGTHETKAAEEKNMFEVEGIEEITDEEFVNTYIDPKDGPYENVVLDLLWTGTEEDEDWDNHLYWGYGTDNECLAMEKSEYKNCSMTDILGETWRWCNDYILEEEGVGSFYVRNHNLKQDIECIVHDMRG